jgi:uncharacterized protein (TIGR02145 family)
MKQIFRISLIVILSALTSINFDSCNKESNVTTFAPTLTTVSVTEITATSAISGGNVSSDGGDIISETGVCWGISVNPKISDNKTTGRNVTGNFSSLITGLKPSTKYYVRAYATNRMGTAYGNELNFSTLAATSIVLNTSAAAPVIFNPDLTYGSVRDRDANLYKTIEIGAQVWMAENLRTTKYNDGTPIPEIKETSVWESLSTPGYCWYNNDASTFKNTYGALYNWYAVYTGKLCPVGWHVPSDDEWNTLISYLGGEIAAGAKVIETGNLHWLETYIKGATNESGFTGLPGGARSFSQDFSGFVSLGIYGHWWTSTDYTPPYDALVTQLPSYDFSDEGHWGFEAGFAARKSGGMSVRCVED